jgi:hypothetical protein
MLRELRGAAARILLPALALQLLLPLAAWAALPNSAAGASASEPGTTGSGRHELGPGGPNSNRSRLSPGGPNSNRSRLNPGGPNSGRSRLNPGGPNSGRSRLDDLSPDGRRPSADRAAGQPGSSPNTFEWTAPNGFVARVTTYRDAGGSAASSAVMRSPEGEELSIEFLPATEGGPVALIDNQILVSYTVTNDGRVSSVFVDDGYRAVKSARPRKPSRADDAAYSVLLEALAERHSTTFLAQSAQALNALEREAVAPATLRFTIECSLGVLGYVASIAGLIGGCSPAAVATAGSSCALAIFAHEIAVASGIMACMK